LHFPQSRERADLSKQEIRVNTKPVIPGR
jgi:hypothetical protein